MSVVLSAVPALWPDFLGPMPQAVRRNTAGGPRQLRELFVPLHQECLLRDWWKVNGGAMIAIGWELNEWNDKKRLQQWLMPDGSLTPVTRERLARMAAARQQQLDIPEPELILEALPAGLETKLRGYQVTPARQLMRALKHGREEWGYPGAVDLSDMGTGKTYMALAAALATGRGVVVLCPVVGRGGWERAFAHFGADAHFIGTYEGLRGGNRPHIVEQGGDGEFRWKDSANIVLILDEAQALRHDDTLNVKLCSAAIRQGIPIIVASATIAVTPVEMRFAGRITGLHRGGDDWTRFCVQHGCSRRKAGEAWKWDGDSKHLAKIHARLFPRRGCRVRKEELGSECPETDIAVLPIDCGEEGRRIASMWEECERIFENVKRTRGALAAEGERRKARMKAWQACELALVPQVAAKAKDDARNGRSVALFVSFSETRTRLMAALNTKAGFYGGQTLKLRQYYEQQFQANREFYLVSNIGAGGASVSLHDTTGDRPRSAYIFPTDHVVHMVQATGRVDRVGGQSKSLQFVPCVAGSLMERMVQSLRRKMLNIGTLNDGQASSRF